MWLDELARRLLVAHRRRLVQARVRAVGERFDEEGAICRHPGFANLTAHQSIASPVGTRFARWMSGYFKSAPQRAEDTSG